MRRRGLVFAAFGAAAVIAVVGVIVVLGLTRGNSAPHAPSPVQLTAAELARVEGNVIEVPASFAETAQLATAPVVRGALAPLITVVGEAAFDPTLVAAVGARTPGIVRKVFFVEGTFVEKNAVLAEIESPGLVDTEADKRIAEAKRRAAELNADREKRLLERGLTTAREYEQAMAQLAEQRALERAARERVAALGGGRAGGGISQLRAPVAGIVAERAISPGQSVEPGTITFHVGSLDRLWILLRVYERHLQVLRPGDTVEIQSVAGDRVIAGKVAHVGHVIDPSTHTTDVRVEVANEERLLRPGQAVRATIRASGPLRVALSVPATAITSVDGVPTVFVAESPTRFVARKVEVGIDAGDRIEVKTGVKDGEVVVSKSVLALKAELFR